MTLDAAADSGILARVTRVVKIFVCACLLAGLTDCLLCAADIADEACGAVFQCAFCGQTAASTETQIPLSAPTAGATLVVTSTPQIAVPDLERLSPPPKA